MLFSYPMLNLIIHLFFSVYLARENETRFVRTTGTLRERKGMFCLAIDPGEAGKLGGRPSDTGERQEANAQLSGNLTLAAGQGHRQHQNIGGAGGAGAGATAGAGSGSGGAKRARADADDQDDDDDWVLVGL